MTNIINKKVLWLFLIILSLVIPVFLILFFSVMRISKSINILPSDIKPRQERFLTTFELPNTSDIEYINIATDEAKPYIVLVRQFESFQKDHNVKEVLSLFSESDNKDDMEMLLWMEGSDITANIVRLYAINRLNYKLNWFVLKKVVKQNSDKILVYVLESRTYYDPSGLPDKPKELYYTDQEHFIFEINKDMLINRYNNFDRDAIDVENKSRYGGFLSW